MPPKPMQAEPSKAASLLDDGPDSVVLSEYPDRSAILSHHGTHASEREPLLSGGEGLTNPGDFEDLEDNHRSVPLFVRQPVFVRDGLLSLA